jgi:transcriptional regulator with XRE-family HTH domain
MPGALLLRSARESSRLTQTELGRRAGTAQSDVSFIESGTRSPTVATLERLLATTRHSLIAIPTIGPDAATTAARIGSELSKARFDSALRAFIDHSDALSRETGVDRIALVLARPARTGRPVWDAALAGLADYWLNDEQLPHPTWTSEPERYLPAPKELIEILHAPSIELDRVPTEFRERNVLVERGTLRSV